MLPNPIPAPITEQRPPTPDEVRDRREQVGHTQKQAAELIYCNVDTWRKWESGQREMHRAFFELYCMKTTGYMKMPWHE